MFTIKLQIADLCGIKQDIKENLVEVSMWSLKTPRQCHHVTKLDCSHFTDQVQSRCDITASLRVFQKQTSKFHKTYVTKQHRLGFFQRQTSKFHKTQVLVWLSFMSISNLTALSHPGAILHIQLNLVKKNIFVL